MEFFEKGQVVLAGNGLAYTVVELVDGGRRGDLRCISPNHRGMLTGYSAEQCVLVAGPTIRYTDSDDDLFAQVYVGLTAQQPTPQEKLDARAALAELHRRVTLRDQEEVA